MYKVLFLIECYICQHNVSTALTLLSDNENDETKMKYTKVTKKIQDTCNLCPDKYFGSDST